MKFFTTLKQSVYGPELYKSLLAGNVPFGTSMRYLLKVLALAAIVTWLMVAMLLGGFLYFAGKELGPELVKQYPADLVVTVQKGQVSINQPSPYKLPVPADADLSDEMVGDKEVENLLVIDTDASASLDTFAEYKTLALITKTNAMYADEHGKVSIVSLDKVPDTVISKQIIETLYPKIAAIFQGAFGLLIILLLPIIFAGLVIFYLIYLLVAALLVWGLLKLVKNSTTYTRGYQVAMHAATLPIIVGAIALFAPIISFPFLGTLVLLVVVGVNIKK